MPAKKPTTAKKPVGQTKKTPEVAVQPPEDSPIDVPDESVDAPLAYEEELALEEETSLERVNKIIFAAGGVATVVVIFASIAGYILYARYPKAQMAQVTVIETSPTPEPTPVFDRAAVTFEVLNGSGTAGAANRAAATLRELGYTVVATGNADKKTYAISELALSEGASKWESTILSDLGTDFSINSQIEELTDSTAAARLIVGKK